MFFHLKGRLIEKSPTHAVIDCNGVGYFLNVSLYTFSNIPEKDELKLFTHLVVKEDSHTLFGFIDEKEREVFKKLISVSGVGPNTGRMVLSTYSPDEIIHVIQSGDVNAVKGVKGIGAKTAQKIIIDLQDKIGGADQVDFEKISFGNNTLKKEALSALTSLGIDQNKSNKIIDSILKNDDDVIGLEELIKLALKQL